MKKCPYCAEEIQDEAVKCRHCGEFLVKKPQEKWYFKTHLLIIAFLCVGPFALPLLFLNPHFSRRKKLIITAVIISLSCFFGFFLIKSIRSIIEYYQLIFRN